MFRSITASRSSGRLLRRTPPKLYRTMAEAVERTPKKEGDISSVFVSLSGLKPEPLPERFRQLKQSLIAGHENAVMDSWERLLTALRRENAIVAAKGPAVLPEVSFRNLRADLRRQRDEIHRRGAVVIRGVVDEQEVRAYKAEVEAYVAKNPQTKAFPPDNPQVFELYWSAPQLKARSHPNMLETQTAFMQELWQAGASPDDISFSPLSYADRLRIRQPGDAQFALGPHVDGGGVERWEREGYGRGGVYEAVFRGQWEQYNPWVAGPRLRVVADRYNGAGACSMFRMFQGWLSMSYSGPFQGTLLVNPLLQLSTAYFLLRPFFTVVDADKDPFSKSAWTLSVDDSSLPGAHPGHSQELTAALHPHLQLDRTMVHVPDIRPGDYVVWHGDQIHAVDRVHAGTTDSSVLYIPVCPTTRTNLAYLARQRDAFLDGTPGPDFPGGRGEADHIDRPTADATITTDAGRRAMGLLPLANVGGALEREGNALLGFS